MKLILKIILLISIALSLFVRAYDFKNRFAYDHDSDLSSWIVKDIVFDKHHRLIGQLTSAPGVFIGSLFYYSLIPFYASTNFDPIGTVAYSWVVGIIGTLSMYYVVSRIHGKKAGIIGTIIYSGSYGIGITERQVVPTMWIFVWTIWFYYSICKLIQSDKKSLIYLAILFSLVWHIQFNLASLALIVIGVLVFNLKRFTIRDFILPIVVFVFLSSPLLLFEYRHGFSQIKSILGSVKNEEAVKRTKIEKIENVFRYVSRNVDYLYYERQDKFPEYLLFSLMSIGLIGITITKKIDKKISIVLFTWLGLFIAFFVYHPINLSEYYLNALQIIWIIVPAVLFSKNSKLINLFTILLISLFVIHNISRVVNHVPNRYGYLQKTNLVKFIKSDSSQRGFPCVSISYITDRGYELGYRYLLWYHQVKTAKIDNSVPVYSIVFPLSRVNKVDHTFGSLGLVLPPYQNYSSESVTALCGGSDYNTTESMFGFTK